MNDEYYIRLVDAEMSDEARSDNVFDFDTFVVTVKTEGRIYGAISKQMLERYPDVQVPSLDWGASSPPIALPDGKRVIFTCLWEDEEDEEGYPPRIVRSCTSSAIRQATVAGCEELALPLIGGGKKFARKAAMGQGMHDALTLAERRELEPPQLYVVLRR